MMRVGLCFAADKFEKLESWSVLGRWQIMERNVAECSSYCQRAQMSYKPLLGPSPQRSATQCEVFNEQSLIFDGIGHQSHDAVITETISDLRHKTNAALLAQA